MPNLREPRRHLSAAHSTSDLTITHRRTGRGRCRGLFRAWDSLQPVILNGHPIRDWSPNRTSAFKFYPIETLKKKLSETCHWLFNWLLLTNEIVSLCRNWTRQSEKGEPYIKVKYSFRSAGKFGPMVFIALGPMALVTFVSSMHKQMLTSNAITIVSFFAVFSFFPICGNICWWIQCTYTSFR